jgi:2-hydroxy-3-keto-5-methylthiopentenyl-1-phosphate phosphatase
MGDAASVTSHFRQVVFSDFDGTITINETFRKVLFHVVPQAAHTIIPALDRGEMTLRQGVTDLVRAIPSAATDEIVAYIANEPIRPGFEELLDYLHDRNIPFVVVSSGLRFYVESRLRPWLDRIHAIHALEVDTSGAQMELRIEHQHPTEAMPKEWVLRTYDAAERIAIGDSLSDFEMVKAADRIFARDRLLAELQAEGTAAVPYNDFFDVRHALAED